MIPNIESKRIAIIGGSCAGKTTLISEFNQRCFATVCEAALVVIEELNKEMGVDGLASWRNSHFDSLQCLIGRKQIELEDQSIPGKEQWVFCDGGLLDPVGYCRYFGVSPPSDLTELVAERGYHKVFALEALSSFVPRFKAGRMSDKTTSFEIGTVLRKLYAEHGYDVIEVPEMSVERRADYILARLS